MKWAQLRCIVIGRFHFFMSPTQQNRDEIVNMMRSYFKSNFDKIGFSLFQHLNRQNFALRVYNLKYKQNSNPCFHVFSQFTRCHLLWSKTYKNTPLGHSSILSYSAIMCLILYRRQSPLWRWLLRMFRLLLQT